MSFIECIWTPAKPSLRSAAPRCLAGISAQHPFFAFFYLKMIKQHSLKGLRKKEKSWSLDLNKSLESHLDLDSGKNHIK